MDVTLLAPGLIGLASALVGYLVMARMVKERTLLMSAGTSSRELRDSIEQTIAAHDEQLSELRDKLVVMEQDLAESRSKPETPSVVRSGVGSPLAGWVIHHGGVLTPQQGEAEAGFSVVVGRDDQ